MSQDAVVEEHTIMIYDSLLTNCHSSTTTIHETFDELYFRKKTISLLCTANKNTKNILPCRFPHFVELK